MIYQYPRPGRVLPGEREDVMAKGIEMSFPTVSALRSWLKEKNFWSDSAEEYDEWLQEFCQNNTITVDGEEWDYWDCWELI